MGSCCFEFLWELDVEVRPRQASVLACVVLARGTSKSMEFYCQLVVGVAAPSGPVGSILAEILHSVEGEDVEQGCSNLETNLPCLRLLSLSFVFISCMHK